MLEKLGHSLWRKQALCGMSRPPLPRGCILACSHACCCSHAGWKKALKAQSPAPMGRSKTCCNHQRHRNSLLESGCYIWAMVWRKKRIWSGSSLLSAHAHEPQPWRLGITLPSPVPLARHWITPITILLESAPLILLLQHHWFHS